MNNTQELKLQTKRNLSKNQYTNMGEIKYTSREKSGINSEKTLLPNEEPKLSSGAEFSFDFTPQTNPADSVMTQQKPQKTMERKEEISPKKTRKNYIKTQEKVINPIIKKEDTEVEQIVNAVVMAKNSIVEEISVNFEKKLEKLDEAIIELISCKTENERLKGKIDNLTRENYKLKKENRSFKQVMPGFFIKIKKDEFEL